MKKLDSDLGIFYQRKSETSKQGVGVPSAGMWSVSPGLLGKIN